MGKKIDLVDKRFGRLVVKHRIEGTNTWLCLCDCGTKKAIERYDLKPNHIKSCGCLWRERLAKGNPVHGLTRNPRWMLWWGAKSRAKSKNIPFTLTLPDIPNIPDVCPILGITLNVHHGRGGPQPDSPTLDRVQQSLGYVPGNVKVISWRANKLKSDASFEEIEKLYSYMKPEVG